LKLSNSCTRTYGITGSRNGLGTSQCSNCPWTWWLKPLPHLADLPISGQNSTPGVEFQPPPKFSWSWYAAWLTLPSYAVLKISTAWWFECYYYLNSYWRL